MPCLNIFLILVTALLFACAPMFTELKNWSPNSLDLNPVDYSVSGPCNRWYGRKISDIDQLKRMVINCWAQLIHGTLNPAIDQLPKRLMMV